MLFTIIQILGTLFLFAGIAGNMLAHQIKISTNLILSFLIGLLAIFICLQLSMTHFLIYGGLMALFTLFLTVVSKATPISSMVSAALSMIFWPQYLFYIIFNVSHMKYFKDQV